MGNIKWSLVWKVGLSAILTIISEVVVADIIGIQGSCTPVHLPCNIILVIWLGISLLLSIAFVQFSWLIFSKITYNVNLYFKTPIFSKVKISFLETKAGEISIFVENKEWRYPSITIEALSHGNLKWKPFERLDIAKIEKNGSKYATFLKAVNNELYIDSTNTEVEKFPIGKHRIDVDFYIAVNEIRIAGTYFLDVVYKGENNISIVNVITLKDIPQSDMAWLIYKRKVSERKDQ